MGMGIATLNINAQLDNEIAQLLATELGIQVEFRRPPTLEELVIQELEAEDEDPELLQPRPPVVTFLGHVDHGKTSLLDSIIGTNVVAGEAGGITQHIRAYRITKNDRAIAFVDTPGHEAFTEMRARGANVTDIVVLVVAADDGVMRQTEEAISHAKAAEVPIIVALNKMDVPGANPERVLQQLTAQNLLPSEWGGDMEVIRTSAVTGAGMDDLLETILLTADLNDYRANPDRAAIGVCLEAEQQAGRGVIAKIDRPTRYAAGGRRGGVRHGLRPRESHVRYAGRAAPCRRGGPVHSGEPDRLRLAAECRRPLPRPGGHHAGAPDRGAAGHAQPGADPGRKLDASLVRGVPAAAGGGQFDGRQRGHDAEPGHPGRRSRFDRSDRKGAVQARTSGSANQDPAQSRGRHHGRRCHAGSCLRRPSSSASM